MKIITLMIFHERTDAGPSWWCDSPELPGFYAVDRSLDGLLERATDAAQEILQEGGFSIDEIKFKYQLQRSLPSTEGDDDVSLHEVGEGGFEWLMHDKNTEGDDGVLVSG